MKLDFRKIVKGQRFFEEDHGVAVLWEAMSSAFMDNRNQWSLKAKRRNGAIVEMVYQHDTSIAQPLKLYDSVDIHCQVIDE